MGLRVCQVSAVDFTLKNFLLPLIDGMRDAGWEVTAVCSDGPDVDGLRKSGYDVKTVGIERSLNLVRHICSIYALARYFRARRFDLVHVHTPVAALIGRVAARLAGVPLIVYTAHGFYFHENMPWWKRKVFVALERFAGLMTDLLFCQSSEDSRDAVRLGICKEERVLTIANGVNVSHFDPHRVGDGRTRRAELGIPNDAFVVGFIGRQVREKGIAEFIQAIECLLSKYPNLWAIIVGERLATDHAQGVAQTLEAAQTRIGKRLIQTGPRNDIAELIATMNLFCLPSWREGMPRTIIEAMMMGKPVVATNIRGCREEVVDGQTGFLVSVRSPGQLTSAIERFLLNPALCAQAGSAGRQRALDMYDERKVVALQVNRITEEAKRRGMLLG